MQSDLEVIRGMYSAFSRGDVASVLAALARQVLWIGAEGFPTAGTYVTPDAVLHKVFMRLATESNAFSAASQEYVCDGARYRAGLAMLAPVATIIIGELGVSTDSWRNPDG
jgi:uncharacterized protein